MVDVPKGTDLGTRITDLEARLGKMERTSRLNSASIGRGGLTVRDGGVITIKDPGDLIMEDADGDIIWTAKANLSTYGWVDARDESAYFEPGTYNIYMNADSAITVPPGFHYGHFLEFVNVGMMWGIPAASGIGNISVAPVFQGGGLGYPWVTLGVGPTVNSGNSSVTVPASTFARNFAGVGEGTPYPQLRFGPTAARSAGDFTPGSGNWHAAVSVIFTREPLS